MIYFPLFLYRVIWDEIKSQLIEQLWLWDLLHIVFCCISSSDHLSAVRQRLWEMPGRTPESELHLQIAQYGLLLPLISIKRRLKQSIGPAESWKLTSWILPTGKEGDCLLPLCQCYYLSKATIHSLFSCYFSTTNAMTSINQSTKQSNAKNFFSLFFFFIKKGYRVFHFDVNKPLNLHSNRSHKITM